MATGREFQRTPVEPKKYGGPPPKPSDSRQSVRTDLGRIADALEKLTQDDQQALEFGPPMCPHCHVLNPEIRTKPEEGGEGPMLELVIEAECMRCQGQLFITIESFSVHTNMKAVTDELSGRRAGLSGE